jgi:hypothetical protein
MSMKDAIVEAIKDLVLPELGAIKGAVSLVAVRIEVVEKRLDDSNNSRFQAIDNHLLDQSRRIDGLRAELSARIDQQTARIDALTERVGTLAEEVSTQRRDSNVLADILRRLARLEEKVAA